MKNDSNAGTASVPNAWIAVDHGLGTDRRLAPYTLVLKGDRSLYQAIADDDYHTRWNNRSRTPPRRRSGLTTALKLNAQF